jgi:hypothetical protein
LEDFDLKTYKTEITLNKNNRGCYILDTIKGCSVCHKEKPLGCYDNCYAKNIAYRYGFDFSNPIKRGFNYSNNQLYILNFYDTKHENNIIEQIKKADTPFIRIGEMGDPSENWEHTINICKIISLSEKPIVIITKHWKKITDKLLQDISKLNICINTSISALDSNTEIKHRLMQYNRLKKYCKSVLRIVSCDFNKNNIRGSLKYGIQRMLFKNENTIDTIFRPNRNNKLVLNKVINIEKTKFLKSEIIVSRFNNDTYFGNCNDCPDMCGINIK